VRTLTFEQRFQQWLRRRERGTDVELTSREIGLMLDAARWGRTRGRFDAATVWEQRVRAAWKGGKR
jgi:hypothetical protein